MTTHPYPTHRPRLLLIGPLPPPIAGTSVSFQILYDAAMRHPESLDVSLIDSAPKELGVSPLLTASNFRVAWRILRTFLFDLGRHSHVLIFSNDRFLLTLASLCIGICRLRGKPVFIRVFGGSLDDYERSLSPPARYYLRWILRCANGMIVQTALLQQYFGAIVGDRVRLVPGYRRISPQSAPPVRPADPTAALRLIFVSHVRAEKGIFDILECLRGLDDEEKNSFRLEVYGPIYPETRKRFECEISATDAVVYRGVLPPDKVIETLAGHDVLLFPSYYRGEGHPGILIESMMAGVPAIATAFRSIPELIEDRVNGLLVPVRRPDALRSALRLLRRDRALLTKLSLNHWERRTRYCADRRVPEIFDTLGIPLSADPANSGPAGRADSTGSPPNMGKSSGVHDA